MGFFPTKTHPKGLKTSNFQTSDTVWLRIQVTFAPEKIRSEVKLKPLCLTLFLTHRCVFEVFFGLE